MDRNPDDDQYMRRALNLAAEGRGLVEPNPLVGAVIVAHGRIIGEGGHGRYGGPHAEILALDVARAAGHSACGATLYVTLEPCAHYGKTPPCAPAVVDAGISRVVMATTDPLGERHAAGSSNVRPPEDARGLDILTRAGVETQVGLCRDQALVLNAPFFKRAALGLPLVIAKWAMSADGKIATRTGASRWISCADSRHLVHELRGRVDAVIVGGGTVEQDDPLLTCREAEVRRVATRVALCGARVPGVDSALVRTVEQAPVLLAYADHSPPEGLEELARRGCRMLPLPGGGGRHPGAVDVRALLAVLAGTGASNVLVEGGREVLGSFFDAGLVDRVMVFMAPFIIGGTQAVTAVGGQGVESVEAALPFVGHVMAGEGEGEGGGPDPIVRPVGRDILVDAWVSDPRQWAPST